MKPIWIVIVTVIVTAIVTAVVVGVGGYFYIGYLNQKAEDENAELQEQVDVLTDQYTLLKQGLTATTTDDSASSSTTSDASDDWKTYTNSTYNFSVTFTDLWEDYDIESESMTGVENMYRVYVPTTDSSYSFDKPGYVNPITISVFTLDQWQAVDAVDGPKPTKADQNNTYVLTYSTWQDAPQDLVDNGLVSEVATVANSAKFKD